MTGRLPANVNASVPIASVSNVVPVNNAPAPPRASVVSSDGSH